MSDKKIVRPATPGIDLLDALTTEVFLPAGATKLASAGQVPSNMAELSEALSFGMQVAQAVEAKTASEGNVSPLQAHIAKTASLLQGAPTHEQVDRVINTQVDANVDLTAKFAAAFA